MTQPVPVMTSEAVWIGGATFEQTVGSGSVCHTDAPVEGSAGQPLRGPKPMEMLLAGAAGCTGADVVSLLKKMRLTLRTMKIHVEGERADEHPRVFRRTRVVYEIETDPVDAAKVQRAVELSVNRYCCVLATLAATGPVTYRLHYAGEVIEGRLDGPAREA
jgi:putative redox protein